MSKYGNVLSDQSDSNKMANINNATTKEVALEFVAMKANFHWKPIAREVRLFNEGQILELERSAQFSSMSQKLKYVLQIWLKKQLELHGTENFKCLESLLKILTTCRLNKVKEELLMQGFSN